MKVFIARGTVETTLMSTRNENVIPLEYRYLIEWIYYFLATRFCLVIANVSCCNVNQLTVEHLKIHAVQSHHFISDGVSVKRQQPFLVGSMLRSVFLGKRKVQRGACTNAWKSLEATRRNVWKVQRLLILPCFIVIDLGLVTSCAPKHSSASWFAFRDASYISVAFEYGVSKHFKGNMGSFRLSAKNVLRYTFSSICLSLLFLDTFFPCYLLQYWHNLVSSCRCSFKVISRLFENESFFQVVCRNRWIFIINSFSEIIIKQARSEKSNYSDKNADLRGIII